MALRVTSDRVLAAQVEEKANLQLSAEVVPVAEFEPSAIAPCDSTELLAWMGTMTAGPPTLAADALRSAGAWAWVRYRWALEDWGGSVRPTGDATSIRQHTRSMFSETVGVGAAGYLGCQRLVPTGFLTVANLDDTMEPLEESGLIRRRSGWGKKQPDYLIVRSLGGSAGFVAGSMELLALECKGTIKSAGTAIAQLAAGVRQVVGIESDLPLRRIVFATTLELDDEERTVRSWAVEVKTQDRTKGGLDPRRAREAVLEASLIRALRITGRYREAARRLQGYVADPFAPVQQFQIADSWVAGESVTLQAATSTLRADIGIDLEYLRALETPGGERLQAVAAVVDRLETRTDTRRRRVDTPEEVAEEVLLRDGLGIRVERRGLPREDEPA